MRSCTMAREKKFRIIGTYHFPPPNVVLHHHHLRTRCHTVYPIPLKKIQMKILVVEKFVEIDYTTK